MAKEQLKNLELSSEILTGVSVNTGGLSSDGGSVGLKIDSSSLGFNANGELYSFGGGGTPNVATKVLSGESGYVKSNILEQFVLSVENPEAPTLNELNAALSSLVSILGGRIAGKETYDGRVYFRS